MFCKRTLIILSLTLCVLGLGKSAWACTCSGGLLFDDNVKQSSLVLLGRVKAQGTQSLPGSSRPEAVYLDVEVVQAYRDPLAKPVVRIWDSMVGTNCGGGFTELSPGKIVGLVVHENKDPFSLPDLWKQTGINPGAADYLMGTCSQDWKVFKTQSSAHRYMKRLARGPVLTNPAAGQENQAEGGGRSR